MYGTAERLKQQVTAYYQETTQESYLAWGGNALALHLGVSDEAEPIVERSALERSLLAMNALLADRADVQAGTRVLDAGMGVGGSSIWLALERGASVVGITLDAVQVELARGFAADRGASGLRFECMDFAATSFAPRSFDVVWNLESLCHAGQPRPYFEHAYELLDDGGRFVCADFFRGTGGPNCDAMCEGWVLPELQSVAEITSALSASGFEQIESVELTARVRRSAEVMSQLGFRELLTLRLAAANGGLSRPSYEAHFRAAIGATAGLASGEISYAMISAVRPKRS